MQDSSHPRQHGDSRVGLFVVLGLLLVSVPLALVSHAAFLRSEDELGPVRARMVERGATATPTECVDEVMTWRPSCDAVKGLCERSVPELVFACMGGQDRDAYCTSIKSEAENTAFGFGDCQARGFTRREGSCAGAWRAVVNFCNGRSPTRLL